MTRRVTDILTEGQVLGEVGGVLVGVTIPDPPVDSVNAQTGAVVLDAADVGAATTAQGTLADSAVQPGDDAADLGSGAATDGYVLTADGAGGAAWEVSSGGGGGGSGLLAVTSYNPGTLMSVAITSATLVDVDATNLAVTFTVPSTGNVLVRLNGYITGSGGTTGIAWGLRESTSIIASRLIAYGTNSQEGAYSATFLVTGLTPSASVTYKWGHGRPIGSGNTTTTQAGGTNQGPATMEVWTAP